MRVSFQRGSAAILGIVTALTSAGAALAHHPMGGVTPATAWQGFLSGVGHPVIGIDHLAFIVAIGLVAGILGSAFLIPLAFIAGTAGGMVLHLASINLPLAEIVIALTVLVAGALVASGRSMSIPAWAGLAAFAGLFHGFAYGEAVFGAETTPIVAYLVGFAFVQFVIASGVAYLVRSAKQDTLVPRLAGAAVAGIGFVFLAEHLMPF